MGCVERVLKAGAKLVLFSFLFVSQRFPSGSFAKKDDGPISPVTMCWTMFEICVQSSFRAHLKFLVGVLGKNQEEGQDDQGT